MIVHGAFEYHQVRVSEVVAHHVGLKKFADNNPWFPALVAGMLSNSLNDPKIINTKLDNLSNKEAMFMGRSLSSALKARKVSEAGVDQWLQQYPALVELSKRNRFFLPMAITIGTRKLIQAPWGLALKVGLGVVLSLLNAATDINAILNFFREGKIGFAYASIAMICFVLIILLIAAYGQNKKKGARAVMKESLIVLSFLKPVIGAFRVVSQRKANDNDTLDPAFELIVTKIVEM